jgi:hypothetical protein
MIKARTFAVAAAVAAAPLMMSATQAFAATHHVAGHKASAKAGAGAFFDTTQTLAGQQATFISGGDDLGRGAGELVSSAYIGGPMGILDIPAHVLGIPKPLNYIP